MGGPSAEAEVSRSSAKGVIAALQERFAEVQGLEVDAGLAEALKQAAPDAVFPIVHGSPGEDGTLQGFLEVLGYPYVGSGVAASAFAMDKIIAKDIFRAAGLPVAEQWVVARGQGLDAAAASIRKRLGERVVVKPARQGSALGVALIDDARQLRAGLEAAFAHDERLLVERRLEGREMTVGVLDTDAGPIAFPVIEITTPKGSWYDYRHRYTQGLSDHLMPADVPDAQAAEMQRIALAAHQALGCRDLSRADLIAVGKRLYLLEVNTLPGMTATSLYPDGARGHGLSFPDLCQHLAERALARRP